MAQYIDGPPRRSQIGGRRGGYEPSPVRLGPTDVRGTPQRHARPPVGFGMDEQGRGFLLGFRNGGPRASRRGVACGADLAVARLTPLGAAAGRAHETTSAPRKTRAAASASSKESTSGLCRRSRTVTAARSSASSRPKRTMSRWPSRLNVPPACRIVFTRLSRAWMGVIRRAVPNPRRRQSGSLGSRGSFFGSLADSTCRSAKSRPAGINSPNSRNSPA